MLHSRSGERILVDFTIISSGIRIEMGFPYSAVEYIRIDKY